MGRRFSADVKRAAIRRSEGQCEAVGKVYGLQAGRRCQNQLSAGVEFDHYPIRVADGGTNSLDNCVAVCRTCHRFKTRTFDLPNLAKSKRLLRRPNEKRQVRGFETNRLGPYKRRLSGQIVPR